uniref:Retrotransposon protein n=1 Tax=Oryza sativa subsp. japonica TaxID=39947 RepID=Q94GJ8_ORYSJ|nr:putative retrotransposon protein [Oryza sativa Japonica Group]
MAEERESFESQWAPSDVTEENLKEMVAHGVLPAKEIIGWRPAYGEAFHTPDTHEVVVFSHFFYGGFSLPTSKFFRGILEFYGISLHHLNPNSIVHIANFVHACEAFLGIKPHFALFHRILFLKPQPNKNKPCVVGGGVGFQLRGTLSQKYFSMPFKTSNKGWHANWFYVQNPEPALSEYSCLPPTYQDTWNSLPMGDEAAQALTLFNCMLKLKEQGLQGEQITRHYIKSRMAPIKERKPSDIDPFGKDSDSTVNSKTAEKEAGSATAADAEPSKENRSIGSQSVTSDVKAGNEPPTGNQSADTETSANQEPPTRNQPGDEQNDDIPETEGQASSPPLNKGRITDAGPEASTFDKVEGLARPPPKIITAKTATLEKLVPHLGTLEETRAKLHETRELARKTEHDLTDRVAELQNANFELSSSLKALEKDKDDLTKERDLAIKDFEDRKIKSQAQFDILVNRIKKLEGARNEVANAATPLIQAMFYNNNGPSTIDVVEEAGSIGASMALAMTKSLYPNIDIDAIDGFTDGTSEEDALELINDAQKAANKIAADVVERFQDNNLGPTGSHDSDDEKTESE